MDKTLARTTRAGKERDTMHVDNRVADSHEATDPLFDTSPRAMSARFGQKAAQLLREGGQVAGAVRMAASYAFLADPSLRAEDQPATFTDNLFSLAVSLAHLTDGQVH